MKGEVDQRMIVMATRVGMKMAGEEKEVDEEGFETVCTRFNYLYELNEAILSAYI